MGKLLLLFYLSVSVASTRDVLVQAGDFVNTSTPADAVLLIGANVVMKGPPWIPSTTGTGICETSNSTDANTSCSTFNADDAKHLLSEGYNLIRLGVIWAGGQPDGGNTPLDADFVQRLHNILDLAHEHGIAVVLDVHQDAVGTAVCGEGVPQWFSKLATPRRIGKPLFPITKQPDGSCGLVDVRHVSNGRVRHVSNELHLDRLRAALHANACARQNLP